MTADEQEAGLLSAIDKGEISKILVIRNGLLGDVVFITPVLERLHRAFPLGHIDAVVSDGSKELLKHSCIRRIFGLPSRFSVMEHLAFFWSLRSERYDIVINQEVNTHYTLMAMIVNPRFHIGFRNSLSFLSDICYERNEHTHAVLAEIDSVRRWTIAPAGNDRTRLTVLDSERSSIDEKLRKQGISSSDTIVCIHIGTSSRNSERFWITERYAEVANRLIERDRVKIILTGVETDKDLAEEVCSGIRYPVVNLVGQTQLRELMAVLQRSAVVVGPDTGTLHMAGALGTPVVMLMGYADKNHTGAFGPNARIISKDLDCIGCVRRHPKPARWETCKSLRPVYCMELITAQEVYDAIQGQLHNQNVHEKYR